jgi:hypothetical protein
VDVDERDTMQTDSMETQASSTDRDERLAVNTSLLNFSDSPFVDDDSWAEPPRAADRRLQIAAVLLGLGVVAIGFFTLGARIGKSRAATPTVGPGAFGGRGAGGFGGAAGAGFGGRSRALLPTIGKVTKVDGNIITMTSADGTTVVVNLADDTSIGRRKTQDAKNIAVGDDISVRGATADDGSITATAATVGDVEPSVLPAAGLGVGIAGGVVSPSSVTSASGVAPSNIASEAVPSTTVPTLGGLLPG